MRRPASVAFLVALSVSQIQMSLATSGSLHHKVQGVKAAHDALAQTQRLKHLEDLSAATTTAAVASTGSAVLAAAADTGFQLYTTDELPDPAPPAACATALTSTIACNSTIIFMASDPYFDPPSLDAVCTAQCKASLLSYRAAVVSACGSYLIPGTNDVGYAPTLAVDAVSGPYFIGCEKDTSTGQYCNQILPTFGNTPDQGVLGYPQNELCTSCLLGTLNATLSNPISFDPDVYSDFQKALSVCGPSWASFNVPPPSSTSLYAPGPSSTPIGSNDTATTSVSCSLSGRQVTTTSDETCDSLATTYSISWYDVLYNNPVLGADNCTSGILAGAQLCLPQPCTTYTPTANQTCEDVVDALDDSDITAAQLVSFNPIFGAGCTNIAGSYGSPICVSPHGGFPDVGNNEGAVIPSAAPTAVAPPPGPTVDGTTPNCGAWYMVQPNDYCLKVVLNNSITLDDFLLLNPEVNTNCTNLWAGYSYCVAAYPPIATITAAPTAIITGTFADFTNVPLPTATFTTSYLPYPTDHVPPPANVAPGTILNGCDFYYQVQSGDNCTGVEAAWGVDPTDFVFWNDNPDTPCPGLVVNTSVCVLVNIPADALPPRPSNAASGSGPQGCAKWYTIVSGDGCPVVEAKFGLTKDAFYALNPELNDQCTNLGLGEAYCVAAPPPTSTVSTGPTGTATTTTTTSGTPTPTDIASGSWTNCTTYYDVQSGDNCNVIEEKYDISFTDFLRWNPEVNTACTNLQLASYCVGIAGGCSAVYTVVSGDFCSAIESKVGISDAQLHALNPWLDANCDLQVGQIMCVAPPGSSGSTTATSTTTRTTSTTTTTSALPTPTNLEPGSWSNCTTYYNVQSGDSCTVIDAKFNIALSDMLRWNPELTPTCNNLALASYCVKAQPACGKVYTVASGDFCSKIESAQGLSDAQLHALNPWLDTNCDLQVGQNLCVG